MIIDFGTANTKDAVNANGEWLGGAITLGLLTSSAAPGKTAERIIKVDLKAPGSPIGRNTVVAIRAGLMYGAGGQIGRLTELIKDEIGSGAAPAAAPSCHVGLPTDCGRGTAAR